VLESIQAVSLLTIMEIVGPLLLLAVLIYGTLQWSRRRRGPTQAVREAANCHEPMTPVFTIAPFEGLPEMLVLYCAPCKHVETVAATSPRPTLDEKPRMHPRIGTPGVKRPALL
jgi:hypothetical protein